MCVYAIYKLKFNLTTQQRQRVDKSAHIAKVNRGEKIYMYVYEYM